MTDGPSTPAVQRLIGVYNADGTLRGELAYVVGRARGTAHCALCDITHGAVREKRDWRRCRDELPAPFQAFHRDDQPAQVRAVVGDRLPVVVAITDSGVVELVGPAELEACAGAPERLVELILDSVSRNHLSW